ncbi:MAG: HIT domain-containing protein [Nitrososphaerota archaeon]
MEILLKNLVDPHPMKILYAPWRIAYIKWFSKKGRECFLCEASREKDDARSLIVYRGRSCFVILNKYPYNNGHLMIAPCKHAGKISDLGDDELLELIELLKLSIAALEAEYKPDGFNVGLNLGRAAGAGLEEHIHLHVVPRWFGDTNFMPVLADTKVVPESLEESWRRLRDRFRSLKPSS